MLIIILLIIIYIFYFLIENDYDNNKVNKATLKKDGFVKLGKLYNKIDALQYLPKGYMFLDYKYTIKGCSLSTYHRDVTSSQYIFKTSRPIYTYIVYYNEGPQISVCPGSHKTVPFLFSRGCNISGKKYDSYLFNCDLVHAGNMNNFNEKRYVEQYKIAHIDDFKKLKSLQGINKNKIGSCKITYLYEYISRKFSLLFSHIANHVMTPYLQKNQNNLFNSILITLYGRQFYNK